ncbi:outer membrane protein OmpA-like peptidoglycan-associated protein [Thioalkalivibrio sp. ALE21]|uniref:OmpA family protein n=1 Tax=Thioalkalivibrio sp. ALE21 TaxID=1158175 RepID=UPI000D8C6A21|nr:OmpA family protein [Thioalkalivibrio sp. ALE21]PYG03801.1 outer membrane protein OmpA-like peptidoglycan-associated protein [Thioalkalivibrio sp. ALE21]
MILRQLFARRARAAGGTPSEQGAQWLAVADLMAALMMIFLFIAVLHMVQVERSQAAHEETRSEALALRDAIHAALLDEFAEDLERWNAELDREDLTLSFREPEVLFEQSSAAIRPRFEAILEDFMPRYAERLRPFAGVIREVRIEGHTSSEWAGAEDAREAYFANMDLSQRRTRSVLEYAWGLERVRGEDWFRERVAAVGMSSSRRVLDERGREDREASRRVEFSVLTDFESRLLGEAGEPGAAEAGVMPVPRPLHSDSHSGPHSNSGAPTPG